jgi:hypothetical protein
MRLLECIAEIQKYFNVYYPVVTAVLGLGSQHDSKVATLFFVNR